MKKIITICLFATLLTSCSRHEFTVKVCNGEGFLYTETWVECDSFQMISPTEADIFVGKQKMRVIGTRGIRPMSN